jgi:hypothetical protein
MFHDCRLTSIENCEPVDCICLLISIELAPLEHCHESSVPVCPSSALQPFWLLTLANTSNSKGKLSLVLFNLAPHREDVWVSEA